MQLDKLVSFHKAVGDPTRIRIISLLKKGPLHGQAIANKLGLSPPTITHHIKKLRDVGIIQQRRDKNTIYFELDLKRLTFHAEAILKIGIEDEQTSLEMSVSDSDKLKIVRNFITPDGKLIQLPSQRKKKMVILAFMIRGLEHGKRYKEQEMNDFIKRYFDDFATIRREWIMGHFMYREKNIYELNPKEMWPIVY